MPGKRNTQSAEKAGRENAAWRKGRKARQALFGLQSQCRRARLRPPAVADRWSRFAVPSVCLEGISRFLRESRGSKLWKAFVGKEQSFFNDMAGLSIFLFSFLATLRETCGKPRRLLFGRPPFTADDRFSTLGRAFACRRMTVFQRPGGTPFAKNNSLSALGSPPFFLSVFSRRSFMPCFYFLRFFNARGPGPLSSGPADGRKQPRFTRNVSAAGVVQAPRPYSVSRADGS